MTTEKKKAKRTLQVRSRKAFGLSSQCLDVDVQRQRLVPQQDTQDSWNTTSGRLSLQKQIAIHHSPSLSFSPGRSTNNLRGNLRNTASSRSNGRLVAPMTTTRSSTPDRLFSPSISCINSVMTPRCAIAPPESRADERAPKRASISSRKTTQGDKRRARLKTALTSFSPSPTYWIETVMIRKGEHRATKEAYHIHDVGR